MFSTFAIVITLLLLMFFAYRGYSVLILAPIMATLAVFLSGDFLTKIGFKDTAQIPSSFTFIKPTWRTAWWVF